MMWKHCRRPAAALVMAFALAPGLVLRAEAQSAQDVAQMRLYIQQLEEQVRQLTGEVERLRFEMRQARPDLGPAAGTSGTEGLTGAIGDEPGPGGQVVGGTVNPQDNASISEGAAPQDLGSLSIAVDDPRIAADGESNSIVGATPLDLSRLAGSAGTGLSGGANLNQNQLPATVALSGSPRDEYDLSYGYVLTGDYALAEQSFRTWLKNFPDHELAPDARFWMAESLFQQGKNREAANEFLDVYKSAPNGRKAPDSLMKLGVSLAALGERDAACATFSEMQSKFPDAAPILRDRTAREVKKAGC